MPVELCHKRRPTLATLGQAATAQVYGIHAQTLYNHRHCRTMSTGSNAPVKKSHPFNISGVVEVSEILAPLNGQKFTYRNATVSITCNGLNNDNEREYDGILTGYSTAEHEVLDEHCYSIKGRMLPSSETADFQIYFDPVHKIDVGDSNTFAGTLHDNTAASGFGIVGAKAEIPDVESDSVVLVFVMKHTDYLPEVEYRMRPTPNLKKTQGLVQEGKETLVHGYIVDWSEEHHRWIVDQVTGLNVGSGHQVVSKKKVGTGSQVTATGRVKPANPIKLVPATPKKRAAPATKAKARAANQAKAKPDIDQGEEAELEQEELPLPQPKKRAAAVNKGKARAAPQVELDDEVGEDFFDDDLGDDIKPPQQGSSTGLGIKAGRQPKRARAS
ncbi:uncharacterized protein MELLADRAFT_86567 [Melampsora larici-populina 98AG31]|uniref:Uncharacterized protein n=1 Tax=Melampsora larici-populina (strain 98AG31 / pathotype 3-4-7) TaxID=747676 RepID=F4RM94_MELLP|nr:uncharacterized protein MELLADRAFT_86567 [Melampsora larici-populina 98AG31]EGG06382.1 hypothetical protein MELLADRAFT_86567 [Melampsora larici-populina 98AG31]